MGGRRDMSGVPADVADENAVSELFDQAERAFGGIDVVVNAAGAISLAPLSTSTSPSSTGPSPRIFAARSWSTSRGPPPPGGRGQSWSAWSRTTGPVG